MRLAAGMLVTPKVRLVEPLGEGGMGVVWVAEHLSLETRVAVKFLSSALTSRGAQALDRFHREAKAAAKLKSPHVVVMHDHGVTDAGIPYIVMELLDGETLAERLARAPLAPADAALVVQHAARALDEAHQLGIVHRDVKPSNLFLVKAHDELFVKVLDFGIAKALEKSGGDLTLTEGMIGTLYYMSPEQLTDARTVGTSADLWSLAVVGYESLTGTRPFDGVSPVAIHRHMVTAKYVPPSELLQRHAPELDAWFRKAFAPEPLDRFASVRELAATFRATLAELATDGDPLVARPAGERRDAHDEARRSPLGDAALGTAEFVASLPSLAPESDGALGEAAPQNRVAKSEAPAAASSRGGAAANPEDVRASAAERESAPPREERPPPKSRVVRRRSMWLGALGGAAIAALAVLTLQSIGVGGRSGKPEISSPAPTGSTTGARAHEAPSAREAPGAPESSAAPRVSSDEVPALAPSAAGADIEPLMPTWPLGCTADARPCGIGCCVSQRGCEPGSCDEPLPEGEWDVRAVKLVSWPTSDEAKKSPLRKADIWLRAGKDGVRHSMQQGRPVRVTTSELKQLFHAWVQPNEPGLPALFELPPRGLGRTPTRLSLCRGHFLRGEVKGMSYWLWLTIVPAGETPAKLCPQTSL